MISVSDSLLFVVVKPQTFSRLSLSTQMDQNLLRIFGLEI